MPRPTPAPTPLPSADRSGDLPLPTLLSQVLVAYTIELDNEFDRRLTHRTTSSGGTGGRGPWLVSLAMWSNLLRFVVDGGCPVGELENAGGNLAGMERWGYVVVAPDPADRRPKPPRADQLVRPTTAGLGAAKVWASLPEVIDARWKARFGAELVAGLRASLRGLVDRLDVEELPEYLPVLGYGLRVKDPDRARWAPTSAADRRTPERASSEAALTVLLSRSLLAFTLDFERESAVSLAIFANVVRRLGGDPVRTRDLPRVAGVSKEAITMALGFLQRAGLVEIEPDPAAVRVRLVSLTPSGRAASASDRRLLGAIEARWRTRFGEQVIGRVRASLEPLVEAPRGSPPPLFAGLEPHPDGWRASVGRPQTLPHHPIVLHRGGYPDGS